jgi:hypothetical protein
MSRTTVLRQAILSLSLASITGAFLFVSGIETSAPVALRGAATFQSNTLRRQSLNGRPHRMAPTPQKILKRPEWLPRKLIKAPRPYHRW